MSNDIIFLPVSLGEAIDKLTILDIKLSKIKDARMADVKVEYDLLYDKLKEYITKYKGLYICMKNINQKIWDFMNSLRDGKLEETDYLSLCKKTIEYNDIRFRIKNKINMVSGSILKEQKGYKISRIFISIDNNIKNLDHFVLPVRYYSYLYDEIIIMNDNNKLKVLFDNDPHIIFIKVIDRPYIFKKEFIFISKEYEKEDVLNVFNLTEKIIDEII
jgi:hypothetical protein